MGKDKNGFTELKDVPITKAGVFDYLGSQISSELEPDRIYRVYRPPEELNNQKTIDSFKLLPWMINHKMVGDGFTPVEHSDMQGVIGEGVRFENGKLLANLKIFGSKILNKIKEGMRELSCGYRCTWEIMKGIAPNGERYDVVQRNIIGNHLASVDKGRSGSDIRVSLDNAISGYFYIALDQDINNEKNEGQTNVDITKEELTELLNEIVATAVNDAFEKYQAKDNEENSELESVKDNSEPEKEEESKDEEEDKKEPDSSDEEEEEAKDDEAKSDVTLKLIGELSDKLDKLLESKAMDQAVTAKKTISTTVDTGVTKHSVSKIDSLQKLGF